VGLVLVLYGWVLTDEEKNEGLRLAQRGLGVFRGREATA
jgi:hypothetical protein